MLDSSQSPSFLLILLHHPGRQDLSALCIFPSPLQLPRLSPIVSENMHFNLFLCGLAALAAVPGASARFVDGIPSATREPLEQRQAFATAVQAQAARISQDPWECITENITQYFVDVPTPTGNVQEALGSFGEEVNSPCVATATGLDLISCNVPASSWCDFTTAAPPDILSSYSTYLSEALSFWEANSETIAILSTSCASAWAMPHMGQREWLNIARAHADCYLDKHPQTGTDVDEPTGTGTDVNGPTATSTELPTESTPSDGMAISGRGMALGYFALMSAGLAVLANVV